MIRVLMMVLISFISAGFSESRLTEGEKLQFVARVIFSEAAGTSQVDRLLVAKVIKGRIGHPGFGKHENAYQVVNAPGAFSCINSNSLWDKPIEDFNKKELHIWQECLSLARYIPAMRKSSEVVYYHDHRIEKPKSWDNRWWWSHLVIKTEHFSFYGAKPRK